MDLIKCHTVLLIKVKVIANAKSVVEAQYAVSVVLHCQLVYMLAWSDLDIVGCKLLVCCSGSCEVKLRASLHTSSLFVN